MGHSRGSQMKTVWAAVNATGSGGKILYKWVNVAPGGKRTESIKLMTGSCSLGMRREMNPRWLSGGHRTPVDLIGRHCRTWVQRLEEEKVRKWIKMSTFY